MNLFSDTTMKHLRPALAACLVLGAPAVHAQSSDAERYINAQGVEVIQGRRAAAPSVPAAADTASAIPVAAPVPKAPARAAQGAGARPPAFQIGAGEQGARDRDRLAILKQEMDAENTALEQKVRILSNAQMRAKLDPEQLKRLQETTLEHERNIRSLTAEINRAKGSM